VNNKSIICTGFLSEGKVLFPDRLFSITILIQLINSHPAHMSQMIFPKGIKKIPSKLTEGISDELLVRLGLF
jgi:hypothetical protein